jgi:hypothetical protein
MLMTKAINTTSIELTAYIETANEIENEASVYIKAIEKAYTEEINAIKEIREQDFSRRRNTISAIN